MRDFLYKIYKKLIYYLLCLLSFLQAHDAAVTGLSLHATGVYRTFCYS